MSQLVPPAVTPAPEYKNLDIIDNEIIDAFLFIYYKTLALRLRIYSYLYVYIYIRYTLYTLRSSLTSSPAVHILQSVLFGISPQTFSLFSFLLFVILYLPLLPCKVSLHHIPYYYCPLSITNFLIFLYLYLIRLITSVYSTSTLPQLHTCSKNSKSLPHFLHLLSSSFLQK